MRRPGTSSTNRLSMPINSTMASTPARASPETGATGVLIGVVASVATALVIFTWHGASLAAKSHPLDFAVFFVLTAALMLLAVDIYGRGSISVSGVTLLATGFTFGVGAGVLAGIFAAGIHAVRRRSKPHKALFNAATFSVAAGAGSAVYLALPHNGSMLVALLSACAGGAAFWLVNIGLLTLVMTVSQPGIRVPRGLERALPVAHVPLPRLRPARPRLHDRLRQGRARRAIRLRAPARAADRVRAAVHRQDPRLGLRDRARQRGAPPLERRPARPVRVRRRPRGADARQPVARRLRECLSRQADGRLREDQCRSRAQAGSHDARVGGPRGRRPRARRR